MINYNDTICAIATAPATSGISIVRVSGPNAISIVDSIFVNSFQKHILSTKESHTISYGFLLDGGKIIDEVLVSVFKAPRSYTAEDTVEINCHGGIFVTNKVLETVVKSGARLALPGEFTKRAFLNGRIDLTKSEAVMDLISSESEVSLKTSISQLRGSLYSSVKDMRDKIIYEIAFIESALDDPEHISLNGYKEKLSIIVNNINDKLNSLITSFDNGRIIREGISTVILGKPNAGKSSLFNALTGYDRAIVTDIEGTTRDIIEEKIILGDVTLRIMDTAGIRDTKDIVEKIGVDRALKMADDAELIIFVIDSSRKLDDNDVRILNYIKDRQALILYNKVDLESLVSVDEISKYCKNDIIRCSMNNDNILGISELTSKVNELFNISKIRSSNEIVITNLRQKEALFNAFIALNNVKMSLDNDMPEDFLSIDLMSAYTYLGSVIGEEVSDDLVNEIFSKFCMGK